MEFQPLKPRVELKTPRGQWYYAQDGDAFGPYTEGELIERYQAGDLTEDTHIWTPTLDEWIPAMEHNAIASSIAFAKSHGHVHNGRNGRAGYITPIEELDSLPEDPLYASDDTVELDNLQLARLADRRIVFDDEMFEDDPTDDDRTEEYPDTSKPSSGVGLEKGKPSGRKLPTKKQAPASKKPTALPSSGPRYPRTLPRPPKPSRKLPTGTTTSDADREAHERLSLSERLRRLRDEDTSNPDLPKNHSGRFATIDASQPVRVVTGKHAAIAYDLPPRTPGASTAAAGSSNIPDASQLDYLSDASNETLPLSPLTRTLPDPKTTTSKSAAAVTSAQSDRPSASKKPPASKKPSKAKAKQKAPAPAANGTQKADAQSKDTAGATSATSIPDKKAPAPAANGTQKADAQSKDAAGATSATSIPDKEAPVPDPSTAALNTAAAQPSPNDAQPKRRPFLWLAGAAILLLALTIGARVLWPTNDGELRQETVADAAIEQEQEDAGPTEEELAIQWMLDATKDAKDKVHTSYDLALNAKSETEERLLEQWATAQARAHVVVEESSVQASLDAEAAAKRAEARRAAQREAAEEAPPPEPTPPPAPKPVTDNTANQSNIQRNVEADADDDRPSNQNRPRRQRRRNR